MLTVSIKHWLGASKRLNRGRSIWLSVEPRHSLLGQEVTIRAGGLNQKRELVLETNLRYDNHRINFQSVCYYQTSEQGQLDTGVHPPLPGSSYQGEHRSGPVWSVRPLKGSIRRLVVEDVIKPLVYRLDLKCARSGQVLDTTELTKIFTAPNVERRMVKSGRVRGTLFLPPPANCPAPAIITINGGLNCSGKVPEDRAAVLASEGFVTLALAFFGDDEDLPDIYSSIDVSYFEEAVNFLLSLPEVSSSYVGVYGISKGADIGLAMMMFLGDKIGACVTVGGSFASIPDTTFYKDQTIQAESFKFGTDLSRPYHLSLGDGKENIKQKPEKQIFIENSNAPLLSLVGQEDSPDILELTSFAISRARRSGKNNITHIEYPETGHLIDLPFCPLCEATKTPLAPPGMLTHFGGKVQQHALTQFHAWSKVKQFFISNL